MSEHTPTPWAVWQSPEGEWTVKSVYTDDNGRRHTAWPAMCSCGGQDNEANAAFIVRAVNCHDELVEALLQFAVLGHGKCTIGKPAAEMARVALAKARGETP